jgi:hypothetical protein
MKFSLSHAIFYLLVSLPISFKMKVSEEILIYPQEILIPLILVLAFCLRPKSLSWLNKSYVKPYYFLFGSLIIIVACTVISFLNVFSIGGLLKTIKYLIYCSTILLISKYHFVRFINVFIKIGLATVLLTLTIFFINFISSGVSIQEFYHMSMWQNDIMPTGFSNTYLNLNNFKFERLGGNHGIYGSYLVLVYLAIVGYTKHLNKGFTLITWLQILLVLFNLALLTSRETFLIFILVNLYLFKDSISARIKRRDFVLGSLFLVGIICYLVFSDTQLVIFSKIQYTINSFIEGGTEGNISLRFNVWKLTLLSFMLNPLHLLVGYGYNTPNYAFFLEQANQTFQLYLKYPTVPESFFFFFLAYGGIIALFFSFIFFLYLILKTYQLRKSSIFAGAFFIFTISLFVTNNTGGSMLSDLLFTQYSLFFVFLNKVNEKD